jgi:DNA-binding transcriptional LysR family regulator
MNIHHLELFYYVARYGGITEAVRNIPYGIQQPAVSGQVAQLEAHLGAVLFQRRPFRLTPTGRRIYQFIEPFFSQLGSLEEELLGGKTRQIRIGAAALVLRDYMPAFFQSLRKKNPTLKITLREGYQAQLEDLLQAGDIDLAINVLEKKLAPGIQSRELLKLPLALLVEAKSDLTSPEQLWARDPIHAPLISLPSFEPICKHFQQGLARVKVDWFTSLEVSSLELTQTYASCGLGIGLSVIAPQARPTPNLRVLPLPTDQFAPIVVGALYRSNPPAFLRSLIADLELRAKQLS